MGRDSLLLSLTIFNNTIHCIRVLLWFTDVQKYLHILLGPVSVLLRFVYVVVEKRNKRWQVDTNCCAPFSVIQLGTFRSPEGEYFVEPLHNYQGEHYEEEHTKPHVVYRKSAPKKQTSGENSSCDTSGM